MLAPDQLHTLVRGNPNAYYGEQQARAAWQAGGDDTQQPLCSAEAPEFLWRVSAIGENVSYQLTYGTKTTISLAALLSPLVAYIPGRFDLQARRLDADLAAYAECTVTCATGGRPHIRQIATVAGLINPGATRAVALVGGGAAQLLVGGVAVTLPGVGDSVPLVAPSSVVAGSFILELDL